MYIIFSHIAQKGIRIISPSCQRIVALPLPVTEALSWYLITHFAFLPAIIFMSCFRDTVRGLGSSIPTVACGVTELVVLVVVMAVSLFSACGEKNGNTNNNQEDYHYPYIL